MMAVELMAMAPPTTTAISQGTPKSRAMQAPRNDRKRHLRSSQPEDLAAHGEHARKGKLQAQREKQEDDAELSEQTRGLPTARRPQARAGPEPMPTMR